MNQKSISIKIRETREKLVQTLNESELPGCILQMILGEISAAVNQLAEQEYQADRKAEEEAEKAEQNQSTVE